MKIDTEVLEKIRLSFSLSMDEWAERLDTQALSYRNALQGRYLFMSEKNVQELADQLGVPAEEILTGKIDSKSLAKAGRTFFRENTAPASRSFASDAPSLPENYARAAFSRRRTSSHLLDLLEIRYGWRIRGRVLQHFRIHERAFLDPDAKISLRFLTDLCAYLSGQGFSDASIYEMGKYSVIANYSSTLGATLRQLGDVRSVYERTFTDIVGRFYDENFLYRLVELADSSCAIEVTFNPLVLEASREKKIGSQQVCLVRGGAFASLAGYLDLPYARVSETSCIHRGDSCCLYEIDFEVPHWCQAHRARLYVG